VLEKYSAYEAAKALWKNQLEHQVEAFLNAAPWRKKEWLARRLNEKVSCLVNQFGVPGGGGNGEVAGVFRGDMRHLVCDLLPTKFWYRDLNELLKMYSTVCQLTDEQLSSSEWKQAILDVNELFDLSSESSE
jgi:hypothetical protein